MLHEKGKGKVRENVGKMQIMNERFNKNACFSTFMLIFSLFFYLFFACFDGAVICVDSPGYIEMNLTREPLYPMFLALFRLIFAGASPDRYLFFAALFQSILAAVAAWSMAAFLYQEFHLSKPVSLLILGISFAVSLLCRFAARRGSMYSNSILTEGLAVSGYLLFFRFLFAYVFRHTKRDLFACAFLSFLMISTRKQMIVSLLMLVLCIFYVSFTEKKYRKGLVVALICSFSVLLCSMCLDVGYNYVLRGKVARHSSDTRFITTMAFYTAERDDSQYIEDGEIQDLFLKIYDVCDESGYLKAYAGAGWMNRVSHFGNYYDCIQIDTMWPMISAYAGERCGDDVVDINGISDHIMNSINVSIIPHNILKIAATFFDNFLSGLVTTVAQMNSILVWYTLLIYLLYILLLLYHLRQRNNYRLCLLALLTLFSIVINVGLVSLVIFCQTRYTIYNMALFYISLLLMLHEPARRFCGIFKKP